MELVADAGGGSGWPWPASAQRIRLIVNLAAGGAMQEGGFVLRTLEAVSNQHVLDASFPSDGESDKDLAASIVKRWTGGRE
jgi:hypothetical protein